MRTITFISRLMKDDSGLETTEVALGIGLLAFIGGFGFFFLGDALSEFFGTAGGQIENGPTPFNTGDLADDAYTCTVTDGVATCG